MFIHFDDLFMFLIFPLIGTIAYIFALRYQLKEIKKELWAEQDKTRELQEKLKETHDEKFKKELELIKAE